MVVYIYTASTLASYIRLHEDNLLTQLIFYVVFIDDYSYIIHARLMCVYIYHHSTDVSRAIQAYSHIADVRALKYCSRDFRDLGLGIYSSQYNSTP